MEEAMFASQVKKTVEFEDGSATIRKLSWRSLEKAREARSTAAAGAMRNVGGDVLKVLRGEALEELAKQLKERRDDMAERRKARYAEFDRGTLLVAGIDSWTYGDLSPKHIDEMPEEMAARLHEEIVDLSLPPLEAAKAEAEGKGESVPSSSS